MDKFKTTVISVMYTDCIYISVTFNIELKMSKIQAKNYLFQYKISRYILSAPFTTHNTFHVVPN